jgi:hypothetical protein
MAAILGHPAQFVIKVLVFSGLKLPYGQRSVFSVAIYSTENSAEP